MKEYIPILIAVIVIILIIIISILFKKKASSSTSKVNSEEASRILSAAAARWTSAAAQDTAPLSVLVKSTYADAYSSAASLLGDNNVSHEAARQQRFAAAQALNAGHLMNIGGL